VQADDDGRRLLIRRRQPRAQTQRRAIERHEAMRGDFKMRALKIWARTFSALRGWQARGNACRE